jgi:hypothetical protein
MITIYYLLPHQGRDVEPGDDMQGSQYRWWSLNDLDDEEVKVVVHPNQKWVLKRAIELYGLWKEQKWDLQLSEL